MAQKARRFFDLMVPHFRVLYDSQWPAIFYGNSLTLMIDGRYDILRAVFYTVVVWQVIRDRVTKY